ncbi:HNH endonuclease [Brevibacillus borstelensis]|uniref:HNH endonuclease signature motif containing protein n=1 Tax=Brevibacillus borstelensis TaxID=45462 RepID=UPI00204009D7|nr:HNH endonuclease signature motif containing protein [Brevibacillus borstelensis]MCM3589641.1 HNH endonuclease [Brevibacillus borstelensis]
MAVKSTCAWCGIEITIKPSKVKANNFCSQECYHKHKARNQIRTNCEKCGRPVVKSPSNATKQNFCSRKCLLQTINAELNPKRMTPEVRQKLRAARLGTGEGKSYEKFYGRHLHRIVAEQKLGRPLRPGEVVHHIDGNIRNNDPDNLMVFPTQAEHAEWHAKYGWIMYGIEPGKGGGAR